MMTCMLVRQTLMGMLFEFRAEDLICEVWSQEEIYRIHDKIRIAIKPGSDFRPFADYSDRYRLVLLAKARQPIFSIRLWSTRPWAEIFPDYIPNTIWM